MNIRALACLVAVLLGPSNAGATHTDEAVAATRNGDYATALRMLTPFADAGDPEAEFLVGLLYANGRGVPMDFARAADWYRLAAEQGYPPAQNNLGVLYLNGDGVPHEHAEAFKWFSLAATRGLPLAQSNLAGLYEEGDGTPKDLVQAYKWASLAADAGEAEAAEIRDRVAKLLTPEQIAEAERLIRQFSMTPLRPI
jgi:TPR repeat protein